MNGTWNTIVLALYGAAMLAVGIRTRTRAFNPEAYALAGRRIGSIPLGLSVMVTLFSAINFTAFPSEIAGHGLYVWVSVPVFLLTAWPVSRWFIPWFRAQAGISGYGWMDARYGTQARRTAAILFLLWRVAWMATALHAAARVSAPLIGLPAPWIMVGAAVLTLAYTSLGGLSAVIWTDVLQFGVLSGGLLLAVSATVTRIPGGFAGLLELNRDAGIFRPFFPADRTFWAWDPTVRISFWSGLLGTTIAFLARYCADQMILQRYRAARSLRAAQRGIWLNAWASIFVMTLLTLLGLAVAATTQDALPAPLRLAALFQSLPAGTAGLVAAGLLAATMSSLDSGLHACAGTWRTDLARSPSLSAEERPPRIPMAGLALVAVLLALPLGRLGGLFAVVNKVINGLGAPLLAMVAAGLYGRGITGRGLAWGGAAGFVASAFIAIRVTTLALHHYAVVNFLITLLLCLLFSLFGHPDDPVAKPVRKSALG